MYIFVFTYKYKNNKLTLNNHFINNSFIQFSDYLKTPRNIKFML